MSALLGAAIDLLPVLVGGAAVVAGLLALARTRRPLLALGVLLDLLLAAGLLRLVGHPGWGAIVTVAAIAALRHLIGAGLRFGTQSWSRRTAPT